MESNQPLPLTRTGLIRTGDPAQLIAQGSTQLFPAARHPQAALAGLLLKQGWWDESHDIAQDIDDPEGSYWHAIIHRLEPDSANSAYWFRRVGNHPVFPRLLEAAKQLQSLPADWRLTDQWDPYQFNQWCDDARLNEYSDDARRSGGPLADAAMALQTLEWQLLFDWCRQPA